MLTRWITVHSKVQTDGETEESVTDSRGLLYREDGRVVLDYEETLAPGEPGRARLTFESDDRVTLTRSGPVDAVFSFEVGCATHTVYRTPHMALSFMVHTREVRVAREPDAPWPVQLALRYRLEHAPGHVSDHELRVDVKKEAWGGQAP